MYINTAASIHLDAWSELCALNVRFVAAAQLFSSYTAHKSTRRGAISYIYVSFFSARVFEINHLGGKAAVQSGYTYILTFWDTVVACMLMARLRKDLYSSYTIKIYARSLIRFSLCIHRYLYMIHSALVFFDCEIDNCGNEPSEIYNISYAYL